MGVFGVICAERLSGKSTLAGTLPGKTLFLQAALLETASKSAVRLGQKLGNEVEVKEWHTYKDLQELTAPGAIAGYAHIYVDGISALTEVLEIQDDVARKMKTDLWTGYRMLGRYMTDILLYLKKLTLDTDINVFCTMAMDSKLDANGNIVKMTPVAKGNVTLAQIQKICPVVLSINIEYDEEGNSRRVLYTANNGPYPGRLDEILEEDNGGKIPADLSLLLKYVKEGAVPHED